MTDASTDPTRDQDCSWADVADRVDIGLSEDFFATLLSGAYLGNLSIDDVRASILEQLRSALGGSTDIAPHSSVTLQPIVHLESNATIGYEAQVVFGNERSGSDVVGVPTRSASTEVEAARAALAQLADIPRGQFLAIKVSAAGLSHDQLLPALLESDVDRVVVEISADESTDIGAVRHGIDSLARLGVRSAIDGAGKGLFRGASLYEVTPALLKIDPSIVDGCMEDDDKRILVEKLIAVGRRLGALVVATGVDSRDELAAALLLGVDAAQGDAVNPTDVSVTEITGWSESRVELDEGSESGEVDPVLEAIEAIDAVHDTRASHAPENSRNSDVDAPSPVVGTESAFSFTQRV